MTVETVVRELRKQSGWMVRVKGSNLELIRTFSGRPITLLLTSVRGKFRLKFPTYIFNSRISHFAPSEPENRFCRNKTLLTMAVKMLKRSTVWDCIENKNSFMVINSANIKADKSRLRTELQSLHAYVPREVTRERAQSALKNLEPRIAKAYKKSQTAKKRRKR